MCHERWAKGRDELVETSWLRDLRSRRAQRQAKARENLMTDPPGRKTVAAVLRDDRVATAER